MNLIQSAATPLPLRSNPAYRSHLLRFALSCVDVARRMGVSLLRFFFSPIIALAQVEIIEGRFCKPCRTVHAKGFNCPRPKVIGFCNSCDRARVLSPRGLCDLGHSNITNRHFYYPKDGQALRLSVSKGQQELTSRALKT